MADPAASNSISIISSRISSSNITNSAELFTTTQQSLSLLASDSLGNVQNSAESSSITQKEGKFYLYLCSAWLISM